MIMFILKIASAEAEITAIYFWQLIGLVFIGLFLLGVRPYRLGLTQRIQNEGSKFILPSLTNEACAQIAYWASSVAFAMAPLAAFVNGLGGIQSIFLLGFFYFFPIGARNTVTSAQWLGIIIIAIGVFLIEFYR